MKCTCEDPGLALALRSRLLLRLRKAFLKQTAQNFQLIFEPIFASNHWTLLVAEKESLGQTEKFRWRMYGSLAEPSEATELAQVRMGTFMDPEFQMPQKANFEFQEQGSLACGFFVLTCMEQKLMFQRGEWLRTWVQFSGRHWRERLQKALSSFKKELELHLSQ